MASELVLHSVERSQPTRHAQSDDIKPDFTAFVLTVETPLRQALVARYGLTVGHDATAAALAWAWENWERTQSLTNPVGYLFRVAQSSTRPLRAWQHRRSGSFPPERLSADLTTAVDLGSVLHKLPTTQRLCVLLVHAHKWKYNEVADLLSISVPAVTNHVHRGTERLRTLLKED
jgi:DNA-directed RNA polymerase specialized sigma24 family protein